MPDKWDRTAAVAVRLRAGTLALLLGALATGCMSPLHKQSAALASATTPVVDEAAAAYRDANTLHNLRVDYDATVSFNAAQPVYNPRNLQVLLSEDEIQSRLAVLAAFQEYTKSLVAVTDNTDSPALDAASKAIGGNLTSIGNTLLPASTSETMVTTTSGNTSTTTAAVATTPALSPDVQNGISTAVNALGRFLVSRKVKKELPGKIEEMDPHVQALCTLLESDIDILEGQEKRDYNRIINLQTEFLRENKTLEPRVRRAEIMKLPDMVREQRAADEKLTTLRAEVVRLASAHHALAAAAQAHQPETLKEKLQDLAAAGEGLGKFYSSVPSS